MSQESCNINKKKDEAEILKSSSPSASPSPPPPAAAAAAAAAPSPSTLFLSSKPLPQRVPFPRPEEKEEEQTSEQRTGQDPRLVASKPLVKILSRREEKVQPSGYRKTINRCSSCHKKVGLTGFRCRCGKLFCGRHRYSDVHDCSFDYKTAEREAISKANPVVRASKIIKI